MIAFGQALGQCIQPGRRGVGGKAININTDYAD
jgi:hypothetical protein